MPRFLLCFFLLASGSAFLAPTAKVLPKSHLKLSSKDDDVAALRAAAAKAREEAERLSKVWDKKI